MTISCSVAIEGSRLLFLTSLPGVSRGRDAGSSCSPDPATKHGAEPGCPRALGWAGTQETSQTPGLLFPELSEGEPASLQPDNTYSAAYFSMFCLLPRLCSALDAPHNPPNSLSLTAAADSAWAQHLFSSWFPKDKHKAKTHALGFS